ncbi:hypothetical protein EB105725_14_00210 [Shimwellia blattae DSM 4481 = NBRC 105725]|nr:hypothetical protein EB105725_14_00210 [Shimwellia blattae DSM 4481 = NBRC 105725]
MPDRVVRKPVMRSGNSRDGDRVTGSGLKIIGKCCTEVQKYHQNNEIILTYSMLK